MSASRPNPKHICGALAQFADVDALLEACAKVRDAGFSKWDAHSPFPVHGIDEAMGIQRTLLPYVALIGGLVGAMSGLFLEWFTNVYHYPMLISGKPLMAWPAFIPVIFEVTVLFAALGAFGGMLIFNGLPQLYHAVFQSKRFVECAMTDGLFISIEAQDDRFHVKETPAWLASLGATHVELLEEDDTDEAAPRAITRWFVPAGVMLACMALIPPLLIARHRVLDREVTRVQIFWDMDQQPKFKAQSANPLFADGRAMRPPVEGTVAQGRAMTDDHLYRGLVDGEWATSFPMRVDESVVRRGQERYQIYCAACHGLDGLGDGIVHRRAERLEEGGWVPPTSFHDALVRDREAGHLYNTIKNGIRTMPPYGDKISVADRWAIVAYIRALQRAQRAGRADVPSEQLRELTP